MTENRPRNRIPALLVGLAPGKPLLLSGPYGTGLHHDAMGALEILHGKSAVRSINCSVVTADDLDGVPVPDHRGVLVNRGCGLLSLEARGVVLDDLDRVVDRAVIERLHRFLATSSATIVGIAHKPDKVHPDLRSQFTPV